MAEPLDGPFVGALTAFAAEQGTTVVAGMFERSEDPERPFNTLAVVDRDGLRASYRKIHLYDSFGYKESDRLVAGPLEPALVDVGGFRVGLMTCYDLRFPELARSAGDRGAELLVAPSAWVAGPGKVQHWRTLVTARAIENIAYVAAVGQPGPRYTGHSMVVGPAGRASSPRSATGTTCSPRRSAGTRWTGARRQPVAGQPALLSARDRIPRAGRCYPATSATGGRHDQDGTP